MKKTILLTGATGFLGSGLASRLHSEYNLVILKRSFSDISKIANILPLAKHYDSDRVPIDIVFKENPIHIIVHAATNYGRNSTQLSKILRDNLLMPLQLAETGIAHGCTNFINTDTFFGKNGNGYCYLQNYTLSKKLFYEALRALPLKIVNCRLEHVYGPRDDESKFVVSMISQLKSNKPHIELTDGIQRRDFVYIDDVINAYATIIANLDALTDYSEFEIGTGLSTSVRDFVTLMKESLESITELRWGVIEKRHGEFLESKANIASLAALGWLPQTSVRLGISKTIAHY